MKEFLQLYYVDLIAIFFYLMVGYVIFETVMIFKYDEFFEERLYDRKVKKNETLAQGDDTISS